MLPAQYLVLTIEFIGKAQVVALPHDTLLPHDYISCLTIRAGISLRAMWNRLKPYLSFFNLALKEEYKPIRGYRPLRILYLIIGFIIAEILNLFFGINLWQLIKPVKDLNCTLD